MKNKKIPPSKSQLNFSGTEREGLLITTFGATAVMKMKHGNTVRCHIRKNADPVITGDRVCLDVEQDGTGTILGPMPRKSVLSRPGKMRITL